MDNLIYDCQSVMVQLLQNVAPDRVDAFEFQLLCYGGSIVMLLLVLWALLRLISAFGRVVLSWFSRG